MKKFILGLFAIILSFTYTAGRLHAEPKSSTEASSKIVNDEQSKAKTMVDRLEVIKEMDKSTLNSDEKKGLRKEVRSIRKELKEMQGGIYLSVGAIILIVILLIVLL